MKIRAVWLFTCGQVCLVIGLILCTLLKPKGLSANDGLSYYGNFIKTLIPYWIAVLGPAICSILTAWQIKDMPRLRPLWFSLLALVIPVCIIAVTPYGGGKIVHWFHTSTATILFILQLSLSMWLVAKLLYKFWAVFLAALEFAGAIMAAIYVPVPHGLLLQAEMIFQLAFGVLIIYGLRHLLLQRQPDETILQPDRQQSISAF